MSVDLRSEDTRLESLIDSKLNDSPDSRCFWWDGKWYSKADLSRMASGCEATLRAAGFGRGQRLAVLMPNCPMVLALSLAAWRLGGSVSPLNVKSGLPSLTGTLGLIEPFAVVAADAVKKEAGEALRERGFTCVTCPPLGPLPEMSGHPSQFETPDVAVIFATSGTTGLPKAVPLTHANLVDNCLVTREAIYGLAPGDVFLSVLPNFHSFGFTVSLVLPITMDASIAIVPGFLPPSLTIKAIKEAGTNVIFGVPTIFSYLLSAMDRGDAPKDLFARAKYLITGGDRLGANLHDTAVRVAGRDIMEGYGLTETSPVVAVNRDYSEHRRGTVGPFVRGYEWRLCPEGKAPSESDEKNPENGEGVLWLRGPSVTDGYLRSPETTAERFKPAGSGRPWFNTGDYVKMDNGYVKILDRVTDIIIVGGFNVYPQEVELVLHSHPAVKTAIVVGMPHHVNGEVPKAFVQKAEGAAVTELEIVKFCKEHLSHFKVPRKVEFVDDFPLSGTGKILRRILRERERHV